MRYRLLGDLEVQRDDGTPVSIPAARRRELLAILLLQRGRPIQRESLIDALWGDEAPEAARESLFAHVSRLRREIGADAIRTVPGGYVLALQDGELDVIAFEQGVAAGRLALSKRQWLTASVSLGQAVGLWRGSALAEFSADAFARQEIALLDDLRAGALEDRIEADLELRRHAEVIPELERLIQEHPLRERLWGQVILALYRSGRQAAALDRYRELRRTLVDELGLDPSPELQELQHRILRQDSALAATERGSEPAVQLPAIQTRTIGRRQEIEAACTALAEHRMLTLTGPGGVGKTRLGVLVAESLVQEHPDGTQFVDLSMVRDPERVLERIGSAVGGGGRPEEAIGPRHMMLVLDNFEQVIDGAGSVAALLARCPNLRIIVTSRAPLRIGGERQLEVAPLGRSHAAALFIDRASAAVATAALPHELVEDVVARLDGLPLALELAAARTKALTLAAIRDFLADSMSFLTASPRDAPDRHRTLRDTVRWSYELLGWQSQAAFRRLAVLAPAFDLDAAMVVGEAGIEELTELIDHSLLRRVQDRYAMLETIRSFAEEAANEEELATARERHMRYFAALPSAAQGAGDDLAVGGETPALDAWLDVCATNQDNLRLAFEHASTIGDTDMIVKLFRGVGPYWGYLGSTEEALRWSRISLDAARDRPPADAEHVRTLAADFARFSGELAVALDLLQENLDAAIKRDDLIRITVALDDLAGTHASMDQYDEAWRLLALAHETHRRETACEPRHLVHTLGVEVLILLRQDRIREAEAKGEALRAAHEASPTYRMRALEAEIYLAYVAAAVGRSTEARRSFAHVVAEATGGQYRHLLPDALEGLAGLDREDRPDLAARLIGMADRLRAESREPPFLAPQREMLIRELQARLGLGTYETWRRVGQGVPLAEMAGAALTAEDLEPASA